MKRQSEKRADSWYQIPRKVHRCADFRHLSSHAKVLLISLTYQFYGNNNGDLTAAWSVMRKDHGFKSPNTLDRARKSLLDAHLITQTRQGGLGKCSLYAITWLKINPCDGKLDTQPTALPTRTNWDRQRRTEPPRRKPRKSAEVVSIGSKRGGAMQ
jgi:hypothetical protein